MNSLKINTTQIDNYVVIRLRGSADMTAANQMNKQMQQLIKEEKFNLIVDLSDLGFICSMGLGSLISIHNKCNQNQGCFCLVNPQKTLNKVFQTTQLNHLFDIYDSVETAIASREEK